MKKLFAMCILSICVLCSLKGSGRQPVANASLTPKDSITKKIPIAKPYTESNSPIEYQASVYDQSHYTTQIANHKKSLKELSDQKVFIAIAEEVSKSLPQKAREYFKNKPDYELLSFAIGNLFQEKSDDGAFIVYDKKNTRVSIIIYQAEKNNYFELYREIKVENGLEAADCNYNTFGTLDYQLADEILYREADLRKKPERYMENTACKIADISKDETFILKSGCFSRKTPTADLSKSLCIATSFVYNNWECLRYDKKTNSFLIFYGQAFAD